MRYVIRTASLAVLLSALTLATPTSMATPADPGPAFGNPGGVLYVKTSAGDDSNDCLTWNTACRTVLGAYDKFSAAGGTIEIANGSHIGGEVLNQGLWFMARGDPGWKSGAMLPGWRACKPVRFIGVGTGMTQHFGLPSLAYVAPKGGFDYNNPAKPAIWIANCQCGMSFENLGMTYPAVGMKLGVDSDGGRGLGGGAAMLRFKNVQITLSNNDQMDNTGKGPNVDVGFVMWLWIQESVFDGYNKATGASPNYSLDERKSAINIRPAANGNSSVYVVLTDLTFSYGGIRYGVGATSWYLYASRIMQEGDGAHGNPPVVWLPAVNPYGVAVIDFVSVADAPGTVAVQIDGASADWPAVHVRGVDSVKGPAIIEGVYVATAQGSTDTPAAQRQVGFWNGHVVGQHDGARRGFGPVAARFSNRATHSTARWLNLSGTTTTITHHQSSPDGRRTAARISSTSGVGNVDFADYTPGSWAVGDWIIAGVWVRSHVSTGGFEPSGPVLLRLSQDDYVLTPSGGAWKYLHGPSANKGEWTWVWTAQKFAKVGKVNPTKVQLLAHVDPSHPADYDKPLLLHVPAGALSENEVWEYAQHVTSWPDGATPGAAALPSGMDLEGPISQFRMGSAKIGGQFIGNGTGPPTSGTYTRGDIVFNSTPSAGGPAGWMCVATGTPGTWKPMANLAP